MPDPTSAPADTRQALIYAAERLFGAHGVDAVSLRQINSDAAQKNTSAAHYYFGSKHALIAAVFEFRLARIDRRRAEMLDALRRAGREHDIRSLVAVVVYPITEETFDSEQGEHYIRFLSQVASHPSPEVWALARNGNTSAMATVGTLMRECAPHLTESLFWIRFGMMFSQVVHAIAEFDRTWEGTRRKTPFSRETYISNLCDMVAAAWSAPVSESTRDALNQDLATSSSTPRDTT